MNRFFHAAVSASLLTTGISLLLLSGAAQAVNAERDFTQNATGACQAALPAYEGQIRKRPLAVQNEGTALAFVTCSLNGTLRGAGGLRSMTGVTVSMDNNTGSPVSMTCTLVDGFSGSVNNYIPKTIVMPANTKFNFLGWSATDNGGLNYSVANVSCGLLPGAGIGLLITVYFEGVGA